MDTAINYSLLAKAIEFYTKEGYKYIELPWEACREAVCITLPHSKAPCISSLSSDYLIGSAEQSFIEKILRGTLMYGRYCACTPCFRNDAVDTYHNKTFMKVELFHYIDPKTVKNENPNYAEEAKILMLNAAASFFSQYVPILYDYGSGSEQTRCGNPITDIIARADCCLELGSYSIRKYYNHTWVNGTGCAEPRLSLAIQKEGAAK